MKNARYELTAAARLDVIGIWNYLAEEASLEIADRVAAEIKITIEKIARSPGIGHSRRDLTTRDVLFFSIHSYLIVYRRDIIPMRVVRIVHGSQDVSRILKN